MRRVMFFVLSIFCLSMGCEREKHIEQEKKELGCITGKVTFFNTGKVTDAYVRLMLPNTLEAIYSGRIGSKGDYKIDNVEPGTYIFKVYKVGFIDTIFPEVVRIMPAFQNGNECRQMDWAITMKTEPLQVLDVNTNKTLDTLNFGNSIDKLYFKIRNGNAFVCNWSSNFQDVRNSVCWLSTMSSLFGGSIDAYSEKVVCVEVRRSSCYFMHGKYEAKFMIESNIGGWVITTVAEIK